MLVGAGRAAALQAVCGGAGPEAALPVGCCKAVAIWALLLVSGTVPAPSDWGLMHSWSKQESFQLFTRFV